MRTLLHRDQDVFLTVALLDESPIQHRVVPAAEAGCRRILVEHLLDERNQLRLPARGTPDTLVDECADLIRGQADLAATSSNGFELIAIGRRLDIPVLPENALRDTRVVRAAVGF